MKAIIELVEYMRDKGNVWFASTGDISAHVKTLIEKKEWAPRTEQLPAYDSPLSEFTKI